jgi:hypothetical protein
LFFLPPILAGVLHPADKLTDDEKVSLVRDLTAEYAKAKDYIPRSKTPLEIEVDGTWDKRKWQMDAQKMGGPAARVGDQVQITRVTLDGDKIVFEINGGIKDGRSFLDHVQVGVGIPGPVTSTQTSQTGGQSGQVRMGTYLVLTFHKPMENLTGADVKRILSPLLEFDKRSVTQIYTETLPPETQKAIAEKRALVGMDREQVLLALGHPDRKYRETKDGVDQEDWIYGAPPGKITFVTFAGAKAIRVKEEYAGLGSQVAAPIPTP